MEKGNSMSLESSSKDNSNRSIKETMTMRVAKTRQNCGKLGQKSGKLCGKVRAKHSVKLASLQDKTEEVDKMADWLVDKLEAPHCRPYFCKCAYHLSHEQIASALVMATMPTVQSPVRYFNKITKRLMVHKIA